MKQGAHMIIRWGDEQTDGKYWALENSAIGTLDIEGL